MTTEGMTPADLAAVTGCNNDFGGNNGWWIILLLLFANGGWGNGYGGNGNGFMPYYFNNTDNNVQRGFDTATLTNQLTGINNSINTGFGNAEIASCNRAMDAMQTEYNNQIATMNQNFAQAQNLDNQLNGIGMSLQNCCCENRLATCQTQNIIQNEGNATRFADSNNTRDIVQTISSGNQAILDKLCQLELDGVKQNYENRIAGMQNVIDGLNAQVNASDRRVAIGEEVDALYNRLSNCPVPTTPVYGRTPIFTCNQNGCGCGNF